MKILLVLFAATGLGLTLVPSLLVFSGALDWDTHARLMLAGMVCWFAAAPLLMKSRKAAPEED